MKIDIKQIDFNSNFYPIFFVNARLFIKGELGLYLKKEEDLCLPL
jgi:hypothetical protein